MIDKINGSCLCGNVVYTVSGDTDFSLICHCKHCQKITGTGHAAQFAVKDQHVSVQGELSYYELIADSGNIVCSAFCGACGCPIYKTSSRMPGTFLFHAGSMENSDLYQPDMVVYEQSKPNWDSVDPAVVRKQ